MTYQQALDYLFSMLPMYQKQGKSAFKKGTSNITSLLKALDNPHDKIKTIHIAGTNGKGSSAHALAAIMQSAGYKTGLYTSPHLVSFTERIKVNGEEMLEEEVVAFVEKMKPLFEEIAPSFFEVTVAMSFYYFEKQKVDIAIIETGLGGRLDSTNVVTPELCLITNIGLDHTHILGDTRAKIAFEKAGIIKNQVPVIIGEPDEGIMPVFQEVASEKNTRCIIAHDFKWDAFSEYTPNYFKKNVNGVLTVVEELRTQGWNISNEAVEEGLNNFTQLTGLKGRFQIIGKNPLVIADVSHNAEGMKLLFEQVNALNKGQLFVIYGAVNDKKLDDIFSILPKSAHYFWTKANVIRFLSLSELSSEANRAGLLGQSFDNVNVALEHVKGIASEMDTILITGSTFVVAEVEGL